MDSGLPYFHHLSSGSEGKSYSEGALIFRPDMSRISPSGLRRIDLYLYAIEANTETNTQIE